MWKTTLPLCLKLLTFREMRHLGLAGPAGSSHCELLVGRLIMLSYLTRFTAFFHGGVSLEHRRVKDGLKLIVTAVEYFSCSY